MVPAWFFFSCDAGPWHPPHLPAGRKPQVGHLEQVTWRGTEVSLDNSQHPLAEPDTCQRSLEAEPRGCQFPDLKLFSGGTRHCGAGTSHLPCELSRCSAQRFHEHNKWLFSPVSSGGTVSYAARVTKIALYLDLSSFDNTRIGQKNSCEQMTLQGSLRRQLHGLVGSCSPPLPIPLSSNRF